MIVGFNPNDSFEALCEQARIIRRTMDNHRWVIGDMALVIEKSHGEGRLLDFAKEVGIGKSSLYNWRKVSLFFHFSTRMEFSFNEDVITYSHHHLATKLGDLVTAEKWLREAETECWTVDQFAYKIREYLNPNDDTSDDDGEPDEKRRYLIEDELPTVGIVNDVPVLMVKLPDVPELNYHIAVWVNEGE